MPRKLSEIHLTLRATFASIVHQSVCEHTGSDGFGHCFLYAVGAFTLMTCEKVEPLPHPQAGSLLLMPDPSEPEHWFTLDSGDGGFQRGEFHSLLVAEDGTVIDFAARHYRRYAEDLATHPDVIHQLSGGGPLVDDRPAWKRTDHLDYLWTTTDRMPSWVRFATDLDASREFCKRFVGSHRDQEMVAFQGLVIQKTLKLLRRR